MLPSCHALAARGPSRLKVVSQSNNEHRLHPARLQRSNSPSELLISTESAPNCNHGRPWTDKCVISTTGRRRSPVAILCAEVLTLNCSGQHGPGACQICQYDYPLACKRLEMEQRADMIQRHATEPLQVLPMDSPNRKNILHVRHRRPIGVHLHGLHD